MLKKQYNIEKVSGIFVSFLVLPFLILDEESRLIIIRITAH